ncbi:rubredoxin [bacterium]|nr:rubredoxin [bacterium]
MAKWLCKACGYVYDESIGDEDSGINPGTKFENIDENWTCPICGVSRGDLESWEKIEE